MTNAEAVIWLINITADIGKIEHQELWHYEQALTEIREMLETEPQRMRGKWEYLDYGGVGNYHCSACRRICVNKGDYDFCPYCGCQMCGGEEDE